MWITVVHDGPDSHLKQISQALRTSLCCPPGCICASSFLRTPVTRSRHQKHMDIRVRVELPLCLDSLQAEVLDNLLSPSLIATAAA